MTPVKTARCGNCFFWRPALNGHCHKLGFTRSRDWHCADHTCVHCGGTRELPVGDHSVPCACARSTDEKAAHAREVARLREAVARAEDLIREYWDASDQLTSIDDYWDDDDAIAVGDRVSAAWKALASFAENHLYTEDGEPCLSIDQQKDTE